MRRCCQPLIGLLAVLSWAGLLSAADIAERPFAMLAANRFDRLLESLDTLLDVADRPELADVLADRYRAAREFPGLDRTKPFGMMRTWRLDDPNTPETEQPADVLFLPVADRNTLLKTITFDTVTYRAVGPDVIAIDRPDEPYHVLFRDGYASLGDDIAQLTAFASRRERILARIPATADLALLLDFEQIPRTDREEMIQGWMRTWEPMLQRRDGESAAVYEARRSGSEWFVRGLPNIALATQQLLVTQTMQPVERRSDWLVELRIATNNPSAKALLSWRPQATPLARLDRPEATAFGVIRGTTLAADVEPWELAWQVFGHPFEQRTAIAILAGPGLVDTAKEARPSSPAEMRLGDGVLRRVLLPATPLWLKRFVGWDPEVWLGVVDDRVWIGFGPPDAVRRKLEQAQALVTDKPSTDDRPVAVKLRLSARDLVGVASGFDPGWIDQQLVRGGDQIRMSVEPTQAGVSVRGSFDVGVLRVLGAALAHDLSLELDQVLAAPLTKDQ